MSSIFTLVTGANGEVGHGLIPELHKRGYKIIAFDLLPLDDRLKPYIVTYLKGYVQNSEVMGQIFKQYPIQNIFHLAAILSTGSEKNPALAHEVNVCGTQNLLEVAHITGKKKKTIIKFIFPSSIAVYGMPDLKSKEKNSKPYEKEFNNPITMYGLNKRYAENLGIYYSKYYSLLSGGDHFIDFRCVRFPGIISAETTPSGGTSDYGPEMIHYAAKEKPYDCFVRADSVIPFMAMPDAISALVQLNEVAKNRLKSNIYNVTSFSVSAKDIENIVKKHFPKAKITYNVDVNRQKIIDSWPKDMNDSNARKDWGWKPKYNFKKAFEEYLIPNIKRHYTNK